LIEIVGPVKNLLSLFKADAPVRIFPQPLALARIEVEAHMYNCYTIFTVNARGKCAKTSTGMWLIPKPYILKKLAAFPVSPGGRRGRTGFGGFFSGKPLE
jgi:hypothetical protein